MGEERDIGEVTEEEAEEGEREGWRKVDRKTMAMVMSAMEKREAMVEEVGKSVEEERKRQKREAFLLRVTPLTLLPSLMPRGIQWERRKLQL